MKEAGEIPEDIDFVINPLDRMLPTLELEPKGLSELGLEHFPVDWTRDRVRTAILDHQISRNHSVGGRYKYSVKIDASRPCTSEVATGVANAFLKVAFAVKKTLLKYNSQDVARRTNLDKGAYVLHTISRFVQFVNHK